MLWILLIFSQFGWAAEPPCKEEPYYFPASCQTCVIPKGKKVIRDGRTGKPLGYWRCEAVGEYDLKSTTNVHVIKENERPKKYQHGALEAAAPSVPVKPIQWAGQVGYAVRTDLADQVKPRLYQHSLSLSYGFEYQPSHWSLTGIITAGYESAGDTRSEVLVNENDTELFVNNFILASQKSIAGPWRSSFAWNFSNEFPTSPEAHREDYGSITSTGVSWSIPLIEKKISASLGTEIYYIWNRYEYSPATGDLNKQGGWRGDLGLKWSVWRGLFVSGGVGSQLSRYLDGTSDVTYRNSVAIGYSWGALTASLSTSNGTYLDREEAYVWFIDEYRRTLSFGVRYAF